MPERENMADKHPKGPSATTDHAGRPDLRDRAAGIVREMRSATSVRADRIVATLLGFVGVAWLCAAFLPESIGMVLPTSTATAVGTVAVGSALAGACLGGRVAARFVLAPVWLAAVMLLPYAVPGWPGVATLGPVVLVVSALWRSSGIVAALTLGAVGARTAVVVGFPPTWPGFEAAWAGDIGVVLVVGGLIVVLLAAAHRSELALALERAELELAKASRDEALVEAERRERETEERFRAIDGLLPVALFRTDSAGEWVWAGRSWQEITGQNSGDATGRGWLERVETEDAERVARLLAKGCAKSQTVSVDMRLRRADGTTRRYVLDAVPIRNGSGRFDGLLGTIEAAERKLAQKLIYEAQQRIERLVDSISCVLWEAHGQTLRFTFVSRGVERVVGATREAWFHPEFRWGDHVHPDDRDWVVRTCREAIAARRDTQLEYRVRTDDGREIWVRDQIAVSSSASGPVVRGVLLDISSEKQAERTLRQALEAAQESDRLKSAFLANMSHEVRTPLNVILGYTEMLEEEEPGRDGESAMLFDGIRRAGRRLTDTIHSILDLSGLETGTFQLRPLEIDLRKTLEHEAEAVRDLARQRRVELDLHLDDVPDPVVRFDPHCLSRAVAHVLHNAVKFTEDGRVEVRLTRTSSGELELAFQDTGVGIDETYLPSLFSPFSQEDGSSSRRYEGSGLGLALTKQYLELNGASISVLSRKGEGSTFTIHFGEASAVGTPAPELAVAKPRHARVSKEPLVVVVEDDPDSQQYARLLLQRHCEVAVVENGDDLRRLLGERGSEVRLVLMDLALRGSEDGVALTRWIRSREDLRDVPVVAVTAHVFPQDRARALEAGCDEYVTKPFGQDEILRVLDRYVSNRDASRTSLAANG